MVKFADIKKIPNPHYNVTVPWDYLETNLIRYAEVGLEMVPEFQRGHVWSETQQIAFVEYKLSGGISGDTIFWNCAGHMRDFTGPYLLVDGLQRLTAVRQFLDGLVPAFGHYFPDYEDPKFMRTMEFQFRVHDMENMEDILLWYIKLNEGGTAHTSDEIQRVKDLLQQCN